MAQLQGGEAPWALESAAAARPFSTHLAALDVVSLVSTSSMIRQSLLTDYTSHIMRECTRISRHPDKGAPTARRLIRTRFKAVPSPFTGPCPGCSSTQGGGGGKGRPVCAPNIDFPKNSFPRFRFYEKIGFPRNSFPMDSGRRSDAVSS